jgi:hypothetical protein
VNEPIDYDIHIHYNAGAESETVVSGELRLLRAFLPDVLKELSVQMQKEGE